LESRKLTPAKKVFGRTRIAKSKHALFCIFSMDGANFFDSELNNCKVNSLPNKLNDYQRHKNNFTKTKLGDVKLRKLSKIAYLREAGVQPNFFLKALVKAA
jgi:hypothetical protein